MSKWTAQEAEEWTYRAPLSAEALARLASIPNPWANPNNPLHRWTPVSGDGPMAWAGRAMYASGMHWDEDSLRRLAGRLPGDESGQNAENPAERQARRDAERAERWMEVYGVPMNQGVPEGMGPPPAEHAAGGGVGVGADEHAVDPVTAKEDEASQACEACEEDEQWVISAEMQAAWDAGLSSDFEDGAAEEDWDY